MRARMAWSLVSVVGWLACAGSTGPANQRSDLGDLPRAEPGVLYALGASFGEQMKVYEFADDEARELERGMHDAVMRRPYAGERTGETAAQVTAFHEHRLQAVARREEQNGASVLERAANEPDAVTTDSGMVLRVIDPGSGPQPSIFDFVTINYRGTLRDGTVFYTNDGKDPYRVQLGTTTRCWQEALGAVAAGARVHAVCPPSLSYGWGGWPGVVPGGAVLSYDLELLSVEPQPEQPLTR